jgi:hypothetical protein
LHIDGTNPALLAGNPYELPGILLGLPSDPTIARACFNVVICIVSILFCYTSVMYLIVLLEPARHAKENTTILNDGILHLAVVTFI